MRGYGYADKFLLGGNFQRVENSGFLANIRMLMDGRIDLTLEDERVAISTLTQVAPELLEQIEFISPPYSPKSSTRQPASTTLTTNG